MFLPLSIGGFMSEVSKMLEELNFKRATKIKDAKVYGVKLIAKGTDKNYILCLCIFKDKYVFTVQDSHGIIELCSFKIKAPVEILKAYIKKCVSFFTL